MNDLPLYIGRKTATETGHGLVCDYTGHNSDPWNDPICGKPATHHFRWPAESASSLACAAHVAVAQAYGPEDQHSVVGSACAMPGSLWIPQSPSFCAIDDRGQEPALTATQTMENV